MGGESEDHAGSSEVAPEFEAQTSDPAAEPGLKHLEFLRVAIINGSAYAVRLYQYGKENSGSLKGRVDSVEATLKHATGPIAQRIESKLPDILQFADNRVDDTIHYLDILLPIVKERSYQAFDVARDAARQAPDAARTVVGQVHEQGAYAAATDYYNKFQPIAESYGNQAWKTLLSLPLAPQAVGTARIGAEKLNQILLSLRESNLPLSAYVPLLPINPVQRNEPEMEQFQVR